jgi:hypothetical protein
LDFKGFTDKSAKAWDINLLKLQALGTEIAKLTREIERINKLVDNSLGNFQSDIESIQQIQNNAFLSDQERFAAAKKAFDLQSQEIDARLLKLQKEKEIRSKQLELALIINEKDRENIDELNKSTTTQERRLEILKELGNETADAYLALDETLGNIEAINEERERKAIDFRNFLLEKAFKDAELRAKAGLNVLKKALDSEFKSISDNISFDAALDKALTIKNKTIEGVGNRLDEIFKAAGISLKQFNGLQSLLIDDVDELDAKLKELGVGEAYRVALVDIWKDGQNEVAKYTDAISQLEKQRQEAIKKGKTEFENFKQIAAEIELQFEIQQKQLQIQRDGGVQNYKDLVKLERDFANLKIRNLNEELKKIKANDRLVLEEKIAAEQNIQNQINQIRQDSENQRLQREIEYNERIKTQQNEILEILRKRNELELNTKIEKNRKNIIFTINRTIALQKQLAEIENERLTIQQREEERQAKTFEELEKIAEKYAQKRLDLEAKTNKAIRDLQKEQLNQLIDFGQKVIGQAQQQLTQSFAQQTANIEGQITQLQSAIAKERELAAQGLQSNVDDLEKKVAEFEAKKREQAKKEQAAQLALAFINSVAGYTKDDPNTAVQKAFRDVLLTKVLAGLISGAFAEGVEGFQGKGSETSDSNLVLISKGESVITAKATKENKGLATAMNEGKVDQWINNNYQTQSSLNIDVDELGNLISEKVSYAGKKIVKHISSRPKL